MIPTSSSLSSHLRMMERVYGESHTTLTLRNDLATLCRLQHEASTAAPPTSATASPKVLDLDAARRLRAEMAVFHDDDPEAA